MMLARRLVTRFMMVVVDKGDGTRFLHFVVVDAAHGAG